MRRSPAFFEKVRGQTDRLDLLLHSVAFAPKEALEGDFVSTTREAFRTAHDISAYSLVALAREAAPLMTDGGSILAMTYYGAEKVVPHYNVMGVAKASLEASTRYLAYDLGREEDPRELHLRRAGEHARGARHQRFRRDAETLPGARAAASAAAIRRSWARPAFFLPATARRRSPARSSTSTAGIRSWGCDFLLVLLLVIVLVIEAESSTITITSMSTSDELRRATGRRSRCG